MGSDAPICIDGIYFVDPYPVISFPVVVDIAEVPGEIVHGKLTNPISALERLTAVGETRFARLFGFEYVLN